MFMDLFGKRSAPKDKPGHAPRHVLIAVAVDRLLRDVANLRAAAALLDEHSA